MAATHRHDLLGDAETTHHARVDALIKSPAWARFSAKLRLSRRELQIIERLLTRESDEVSIAGALGISRHTVHTHVCRLYRKAGVSNHGELVSKILVSFISEVLD